MPIRWVLIRDPLGKFATQALLCTDQEADPVQVLLWFARRWQMEVTFHEVRAHVGVETQRQWSEQARAGHCAHDTYPSRALLAGHARGA